MKKITSLLLCSILSATSAIFAVDKNLCFDKTTTVIDSIPIKVSAAYVNTVNKSSEFPFTCVIENTNNYNMFKFLSAEGPVLADYSGMEIQFDYATYYEIPQDLQIFFSTDGFGRGYYPVISSIIGESTTLTINFDAATYPNLFVDASGVAVAADKKFNRFGFRSGNPNRRDVLVDNVWVQNNFTDDYKTTIKIKSIALINKATGAKEYFDVAGGGLYDGTQSYRLYGESASFTLGVEGFVAWDLSAETVEYINVYLDQPLTADAAAKLSFESAEFVEIDNSLITGLAEGSSFISIDARTLDVQQFSFLSLEGGIELFVKRVALSDSQEQQTSVKPIYLEETMPDFVNVYTISGQLIRQNVAREQATQNLDKGLYIINNKKIAIIK